MLLILWRKEDKEIFEKYRIISCISEHTDSTVWLAEHIQLKQIRIIKGIRLDSPIYTKLLDEAFLMKNLKHPNIPEIYDLESDNNFTYIIEQYIPGESLKSLCNHKLLSQHEIFQFIIQISSIVEYLHSLPDKIIHLDIKPENIILYENTCYLIDFGSARVGSSKETVCLGSPLYAAPEQFTGEGTRTESDIYALGKLLLFFIEHGNINKFKEKKLRTLAEKCIKKRFWNRLGTTTEFLHRIKELQKKTEVASEASLKLAVISMNPCNGVTYVSLLFTAFLALTKGSCNYIETKDSNVWNYLDDSSFKKHPSINLIDAKHFEMGEYPDSSCVYDLGSVDAGIPDSLYDADCICILCDRMPWHNNAITRAKALTHKFTNRLFLINMSETATEKQASLLKGEKFAAIPFINNPDDILNSKNHYDLFRNIISLCEDVSIHKT